MTAQRAARLGALDTCRSCGSERLTAVFDGESTNFLCEECHACWLVTMGWVVRVDPSTCPGCPRHEECVAAFAAHDGCDAEVSPVH
jgi:hypothetical protein